MLATGIDTYSVPTPDVTNIISNRLSRYQQILKQKQNFWKLWKREYLARLQQRSKWQTPLPNVTPNQLVLLLDDNSSLQELTDWYEWSPLLKDQRRLHGSSQYRRSASYLSPTAKP